MLYIHTYAMINDLDSGQHLLHHVNAIEEL